MVAFNRNFGFPQQPQIGRGLVNLRNNSLRPGTLTQMPHTEVGRLTGESPKTGGVDNKPDDKKIMGETLYFDSYEDLAKWGQDHRWDWQSGITIVFKTTLNGKVVYKKGVTTKTTGRVAYDCGHCYYKDQGCTTECTG